MRQLKRLACWLLGAGIVLGASPKSRAQTRPSEQARVYTITNSGADGSFQIPQIRLPNTAVARRINRQLLSIATGDISVDTTASPSRQLAQVARECCYDEEIGKWRNVGDGTTGITYEVLLNQNYLLSLQFQYEYQGLIHPATSHLTFDLRTGRQLTLANLIADSPAQLGRRLQAAISRRLRDELAEVVANYGDDSTQIEHVAQLYNITDWNTTPQRGLRLDTADGAEASIGEFALRPGALLLFHSVGMSRYNFEFLPDETYVFPFARLQLRPLLQPVAQATAAKKK